MAGLSKQQVIELEELDRSLFDPGEWVALTRTRAFLTGNGKVDTALQTEFEAAFNPADRRFIQAAVKGMFTSNLTSNTGRLWSTWLTAVLRRLRRKCLRDPLTPCKRYGGFAGRVRGIL